MGQNAYPLIRMRIRLSSQVVPFPQARRRRRLETVGVGHYNYNKLRPAGVFYVALTIPWPIGVARCSFACHLNWCFARYRGFLPLNDSFYQKSAVLRIQFR